MFNIVNKRNRLFIEGGRISDTRLHVILVAPPGCSKTYWLEQMMRGDQAILLNSGIDNTMENMMTGAGFVGTTKFKNGEKVKELGLAEERPTAIIGIEEFSAVTNMFKATHSGELDTALLGALDSVSGSEYLYYRSNGQVRYNTLEKLYKDFHNGEYIEVLGLKDIYGTIDWCQVQAAADHGLKEVFEVTLGDGKHIKVTKDHSLFTKVRRYKFSSYKAEIKPTTFEDAKNIISITHEVSISGSFEEDFATFIGLWIADGSFARNLPNLVCMSTGNNRDIIEFIMRFGHFKDYAKPSKGDYMMSKKSFIQRMLDYGVDRAWRSATKRVPRHLFVAPDKEIAAFLKGYFSGDGSLNLDKTTNTLQITGNSICKELLEDVQCLLARLGIASRLDGGFKSKKLIFGKYEVKNACYMLHIRKIIDVEKFLKKIGFIQQKVFDPNPLKKRKYRPASAIPRQIRSIKKVGYEHVYDLKTEFESFVVNGILCHNSGYCYKRLASGPIKYQTFVTLQTGVQPARFNLSSGLGRRLLFIEFIPTRKDWNTLRWARRRSRGKDYNPTRTGLIRRELRELSSTLNKVKDVVISEKFYDFIDQRGIIPYEEALYEKLLIGHSIMRGRITNNVIMADMDKTARSLLGDEVKHRKNIKKGSEFSQVFVILEDYGGIATREDIREMLLNYGCDYTESSTLISQMQRMHMITLISGDRLVLPGYTGNRNRKKKK